MEKLNKKQKLYVMVGIPGSGKSTFIETVRRVDEVVVSRDTIRLQYIQDRDNYFSREKEVFQKYIEEIKNKLALGYNVYADATHLNKGSRAKLLNALGAAVDGVQKVAIYFNIPLETALEWNEKREGLAYVPPSAIKSMRESLTIPTKEEGFDEILFVKQFKND